MARWIRWSMVLLLFLQSALACAQYVPVTVERVVDGDTLIVTMPYDLRDTVRLIGVNAPERNEPWGTEATAFATRLLPVGLGIELEVGTETRDHYNRLLAYAYLPSGQMVNAILAQEGLARVLTIPPNTKYAALFAHAEEQARDACLRLWSDLPPCASLTMTIDPQREMVTITNVSNGIQDLSSLQLRTSTNSQSFQVPVGTSLRPGQSLCIVSGAAFSEPGVCLPWRKANTWNNQGALGQLLDHKGSVVAAFSYGSAPRTGTAFGTP